MLALYETKGGVAAVKTFTALMISIYLFSAKIP